MIVGSNLSIFNEEDRTHISQGKKLIRNLTDKYASNVTKRGNVPVGKAGKHEEERVGG